MLPLSNFYCSTNFQSRYEKNKKKPKTALIYTRYNIVLSKVNTAQKV